MPDREACITVSHLTKVYRRPPGGLSLRGLLGHALSGEPRSRRDFLGLSDVNLAVRRGESVGLIGPNGAGKSTLLKIIGGITGFDHGRVEVRGSVASLIELGAGFHPDLTGRENIYLNGSLMGQRRRQISDLEDQIVAFAGLGDYIDMPVRTYSSGMVVRLGFAVAIHVRADVLLIDEVLSVGDMAFQASSFERIQAERRNGTTIVFVSHSMPAVSAVCDRVGWIEGGRIRALSSTLEVLRAYQDEQERIMRETREAGAGTAESGTGDLIIDEVQLLDAQGQVAGILEYPSPFSVRLRYILKRPLPSPYFMVTIQQNGVPLFGASMLLDGEQPRMLDGTGTLECRFERLPLLPGTYEVALQVRANPAANYLGFRVLKGFSVTADFGRYGLRGDFVDSVGRSSPPVFVPYRWNFTP